MLEPTIIHWQDATHPVSEWQDLDVVLADKTQQNVFSMGFFLKGDEHTMTFCASWSYDAQGKPHELGGVFTIPTRCIIEIKGMDPKLDPPIPGDPGERGEDEKEDVATDDEKGKDGNRTISGLGSISDAHNSEPCESWI